MKRITLLSFFITAFISTLIFAAQNPDSKGSMMEEPKDAIAVIMQDHQHIGDMINRLEQNLDSNIKESHSIFNELTTFIVKHETMEQKVWYPELEKNKDLKEIVADLKKEEADAGKEIKKINGIKNDSEWVAEVKKFIEAVKQHANDEETKLFPKVQQAFDEKKLEELGEKLKHYKKTHQMKY